jgi:hypothetical protein
MLRSQPAYRPFVDRAACRQIEGQQRGLFCRLIVSSESPLSETHFHSLEIILMQPTRALDTQGDLTSPRGTSNTTSHVIIGGSDNTLAKKVESG